MKRTKLTWLKRTLCVALAVAMCFGLAPNMCVANIFAADTGNTPAQDDDVTTGSGGVSDTLTTPEITLGYGTLSDTEGAEGTDAAYTFTEGAATEYTDMPCVKLSAVDGATAYYLYETSSGEETPTADQIIADGEDVTLDVSEDTFIELAEKPDETGGTIYIYAVAKNDSAVSAVASATYTIAAKSSSDSENNDTDTNTNDNTTSNEEEGIMLMSEGEDTSAAVTIKDENLRKAICTQLGITYTQGTTITENQMASLTELKAENAGITDLTGLEKAVNLETLDLSGNDLSNDFKYNSSFVKKFQMNALKVIDVSDAGITSATYLLTAISNAATLESVDLSDNELSGTFTMPGVKVTWSSLKTLDLSNNNLNGISFSAVFTFPSLEKIDLTQNRIWADENSGDWYETAVNVGLEKLDFSNQKSMTELSGVYIKGTTDGYDSSLVDNEKRTINLGSTLSSSITFKVQGYGEVQTMSGTLDGASMPVMIASPSTVAATSDNCMFTLDLTVGTHALSLVLTHANGETVTYTIHVTRNSVPSNDSDESAGITDPVLQELVCTALNELDEYEDKQVDYTTHVVTRAEMEKLTELSNAYDGTTISNLSGLEYAVKLEYLELKTDITSEIDVSNWTSLTWLSLTSESNNIKGLSSLTSLEGLSLSGNFKSLDGIEKLEDLTDLSVSTQLSTALNVSKLTELAYLEVATAADGTLPDTSGLTQLVLLTIYDYANATSTPVINSSSFQKLNLKDCSGTVNLRKLSLAKTTHKYMSMRRKGLICR